MINLGLCTDRRPQILWSEIFFGPFHKTWNLHSSYIYPFWQLVFWPLNGLFWPLLNIFWQSKHYQYYANGIFFTKIVLTYCEKKLWSRKTFEIRRWRPRICKKQNAFITCSWRFLISNELEQLDFKLEKYWVLETCRKS